MVVLENKAKFIGAVKSGRINSRSLTDKSLVNLLKKDFAENPRCHTYEYLIGMSYRSFTNESAERMRHAVLTKAQEIDRLEAQTHEQMWIDDIKALLISK